MEFALVCTLKSTEMGDINKKWERKTCLPSCCRYEKGEKESIGLQESERVKSLWNSRHNATMMVFLLPFLLWDKFSSGVYKRSDSLLFEYAAGALCLSHWK